MGYLNPRPDERSIGHYYPEDYEPYRAPDRERSGWWGRIRRRLAGLVLARQYGYPPPLTRWHQRLLADVVRPWFGPDRQSLTTIPYRGEGRLLDYGCGSGWYARRMQQRGWQVTGMDFNATSLRQVERRYGIKTLVGMLPHPEVAPGSFDTVTMGAVLEHVHDPHRVIAAAAQALAPGGNLVISVPNLAGWGFRYFGRDWFGLELPRHLLHFTPATLRRLVEAHGLIVREVSTPVRMGWLRRSLATARRRSSPSARRFLSRAARVRLLASVLGHWAGRKEMADSIRLIAERPISWSGAGTAQPGRFLSAA
jgi:2-polyprenyl-3-methyl-5-hydroxy-6-metoxy-1,4-benzoquinol methylase